MLAVLAGLGLAALAATRFGRLRGFLLAVALVTLVWAAFDIREVVHQLDESRTGIAVVAMTVAALHRRCGGHQRPPRPPAYDRVVKRLAVPLVLVVAVGARSRSP